MPHLIPPEGIQSLRKDVNYFESLGERASPILRYQREQPNYVYFVQNVNDWSHMEQHYQPFKDAVQHGPNADRIRFEMQIERHGHNPPLAPYFLSGLDSAVNWLREIH